VPNDVSPNESGRRISARVAMPSAFASSHIESSGQIASAREMTPSSLPPSSGRSYCARATNPLGAVPPSSSGVPTPKSSEPSSTRPLRLRSSVRNASSPRGRTHCTWSGNPSALTSKDTPRPAGPSSTPSRRVSTTIGLHCPQTWVESRHRSRLMRVFIGVLSFRVRYGTTHPGVQHCRLACRQISVSRVLPSRCSPAGMSVKFTPTP
jgi:hypothetical protein